MESDKKIALEGKPKKIKESYPLITVGALIFNKKGQILFLKSNKWKGQYGIPAGKLHYGEKIIDGLRREVREETHIEVYDIKFLLTQEIINLGGFFKKAHYVSINFACKAKNSSVRLNYEAESYSWIRPGGALKYNLNKPTKELVQCYLKLSNKDKITIKELEVECIVGIRKKERKEKQKVYVTVDIFTNTRGAAKSSNIKNTVDYSSLAKNIKKLIINKRYRLLETMAEDIAKLALKNKKANKAIVLVKKPKAVPKGKYAAVEIERQKNA